MSDAVKQIITEAVFKGALKAASSPATDATRQDVPKIANDVINEVAPIIVNATNNEPWYQSRVTWGAIGAIALPLLGLVGVTSDVIDQDQFVALGLALGTVASGALTLYGRWKARKPIGE